MIPRSLFAAAFWLAPFAGPLAADTTPITGYKQDALCVSGDNALCPELPTDLEGLTSPLGYTPTTNVSKGGSANSTQQPNFDFFGWQMFMALNWPADDNGAPIGDITDAALNSAPRVWESYPTLDEVFGAQAPSTCKSTGRMALSRTSKVHSGSFISPMTSSPLIDVAGNFVMFDIRLNEVEHKYLRDNHLTTTSGQKTFGQAWELPKGTRVTKDGKVEASPGALEMKTSWRILPEGQTDGYFTVPGVIEVPADNSATGQPLCLDVTFGLVGMHIMQKISTPFSFSDYWVWATFEHVKNAPLAKGASVSQRDHFSNAVADMPYDPVTSCPVPENAGDGWSFFQQDCVDNAGKACTPNAQLPHAGKIQWQPEPPYAKSYLTGDGKYGTQVTRCWGIYPSAKLVSSQFHKALSGSVWQNYDLVGVQWATGSLDNPVNTLEPFPAPIYLVNTTLETYLQNQPVIVDGVPNTRASGSCITCHDNAKDNAGNKSDFSFLGFYAKSGED